MVFFVDAILTVSYVELNRGQGCLTVVRGEVRVARKALHPGYRWVYRNAFFLVPRTSPLVPVTQHNVYYVK